jgi:nucleoside 2-deoxyribosyltransferase
MSWYFAGQFARLAELAGYAAKARLAGLTVTSRWLSQDPVSGYAGGSSEIGREFAERDLEDITAADGLLFFAEDPAIGIPRGGRHVEFGFALAIGKALEVVGSSENVFHMLEDVAHYLTFEEWLTAKLKEAK